MLEIKAKLKVRRSAYNVEVKGRLELPFEQRRRGRFEAALASGEEVGVRLPPGEILRGGDLVTASDGRVIEIVAQAEKILEIRSELPSGLARLAYDLGSRHVPVQVGEGWLRITEDADVERLLDGLGAKLARVSAPFEPDAGVLEGSGHGQGAAQSHECKDHDHHHHHDHGHGDHGHGHRHGHDHEH